MIRPTSHRTYQGTGAITHRTDYEHLGKVLAEKQRLKHLPLVDEEVRRAS